MSGSWKPGGGASIRAHPQAAPATRYAHAQSHAVAARLTTTRAGRTPGLRTWRPARSASRGSSHSLSASPAESSTPLTCTAPRATWTYARRPGASSRSARSAASNSPPYTRTSWWTRTEPDFAVLRRDEPQAGRVSRPPRSASLHNSAECRTHSAGSRSAENAAVLVCEALNSLWRTPLPALMRCTSPGRIVEPVPMESWCASSPSST